MVLKVGMPPLKVRTRAADKLHMNDVVGVPSRSLKGMVALAALVGALALPLLKSAPASAAVLPVGSSGGANLIFADEFSGTALNTSTWRTCFWWASSTCSIETNNELELYTPSNVSVTNGALALQARRESAVGWNGKSYAYTSGMVMTGGQSGGAAPGFTYRYGYAEARVKVPAGQGLWPAFWALPASYGWPPEIDAMEILGSDPSTVNMTYHYLNGSGTHMSPGQAWTGPDFSQGWHTFGVDWQPDAMVWYVDGVERGRFTDAAAITSEPAYLLLNLAVGGTWPGSPNASTAFPSDYLVDYVRVWDHFGTPTPPAPATGYAGAVAADGPVSYWRLGDASGTVAADVQGANAGTYLNGVTLGAPSLLTGDPANRAASFDGVNDAVSIPSTSRLSPAAAVTVEAWVRPTSLPGAGTFRSVATKAESYSLQFNGGQLEFTTMVNGTRRRAQAPAGALVAGQTYHVVGTYDGTTQRLFVNGTQVASAGFTGSMGANTNPVVIGSWDTASEFLAGTIDDVAVYDKALTARSIADHFTQGSSTAPPPPSTYRAAVTGDGPAGYWRLGEATGVTAADEMGASAGTYRNGVSLGVPSLTNDGANPAVSLDGSNDAVTIPSSAGLSPSGAVTVEAWIRPAALPSSGNFASIVTKAESYSLQFNGGRLEFTTMRNGARRRTQAPAGAIVAGQTYHVVGTFDGTAQRVFVNGAQVATSTFSGGPSVNTTSIVLGSWDASSEFLSGRLDDVAVYAKALTATQVANHYNQGKITS